MRKLLLVITFALWGVVGFSQKKWQKEGIQVPPPVCYASDEEHRGFVEPPDEFLKRLKSTAQKKSTIHVTYVGFTQAARTAFQYAVEIWEHLIVSPVPIYVNAQWRSLDENVLGSCGPYIYFENFDAAPYRDHYYPVALAEKLEGKEITGESTPDIIAQFNKDIPWYYGVDGKTPTGSYDLVSVVLHEIGHGLGFTGFFFEIGGQGAYGDFFPYPGIFDEFVINQSGQQLVDISLFDNPSAALLQQFQSGNLRYKSPTARAQSAVDAYPRLYAPTNFDEGSSIYHLNENTYRAGNPNSLMTPFFSRAEAIHDPGPLTMGIFADMGWNFTQIIHREITDREVVTGPILVEAEIKTDSEIDSSSVVFVYTNGVFADADTLQLAHSQQTGLFTASLNAPEDGNYRYYLSVQDTSGRTFFAPVNMPASYYDFTIGADQQKPLVAHLPIIFLVTNDLNAEIVVTATDNIGIQSVIMEYIINNGGTQTLSLQPGENNTYSNTLGLPSLADGDSVRYRIIATDSSSNSNQAVLPEEGYYTIRIDGFYDPVEIYTNDFNKTSRDFILSGFFIGEEPLFTNGALHSLHPYPSPNEDDQTINLISVLKYPIILNSQALMAFNEIVLVEPGESGSRYGAEDFWDYVVVEGSKNGVDGWLPLLDGYDSRANSTWLTNYNSTVASNTVGKESYYVYREFKMTANGNFKEGDIIFIRFRLFSDPYEHGWGWAIDDLKIQDPTTDIDDTVYSPGELVVYPNPAKNSLFIEGGFKAGINRLDIAVFNSFGQQVMKEMVGVSSTQFSHTLDINSLSPGLYLLTFGFENGQKITRKFVKQ